MSNGFIRINVLALIWTSRLMKQVLYPLFDEDFVIDFATISKREFTLNIDWTSAEVKTNVCARRAQKPSLLGLCRAAAKRLLKTNVCARREQKPSLLGLCRAAAKGAFIWTFVQGESRSQVYLDYAEPPPIFVQASAEPNLFGLCRAQPKMSRKRLLKTNIWRHLILI